MRDDPPVEAQRMSWRRPMLVRPTAPVVGTSLLFLSACSAASAVAVGTVKAAGGIATSAAVGGAKLTARGVGAGVNAVAGSDIETKTLAHRAGLATGEDRKTLSISEIYTDDARTDFLATTRSGSQYACHVIALNDGVSGARCLDDFGVVYER